MSELTVEYIMQELPYNQPINGTWLGGCVLKMPDGPAWGQKSCFIGEYNIKTRDEALSRIVDLLKKDNCQYYMVCPQIGKETRVYYC